MRIVVCIKQVPDTNEVRIDPKTGTLMREGVPCIINPDDKAALEAALRLKDRLPGTYVTVLSMGPLQAKDALYEALAMGADEGVLVSDRDYAGSDTWATSNILAAAVQKIADYDVVICGRQAIDGDTAQVGPQLAERLNMPQITYVTDIVAVGESTLEAVRATQNGHQVVRAGLPCLLTVMKGADSPRYPNIRRIFMAYGGKVPLHTWSQAELNLPADRIGLNSSPTNVKCTFAPDAARTGVKLCGTDGEMVAQLMDALVSEQILSRGD